MLSAAEPPAPTVMQRMATAASTGFIGACAQTRPVTAVSTTSDMTLGFIRVRKSRQVAARTLGLRAAPAATSVIGPPPGPAGVGSSMVLGVEHRQVVELVE